MTGSGPGERIKSDNEGNQRNGVTATRSIGIVMNGATGRMGYRQHLVGSILAIRDRGGVTLRDGSRVIPEPVLVGRSAQLGELGLTSSGERLRPRVAELTL